jgi:hypothetical protein
MICDYCQGMLEISPADFGRRATCPYCKQTIAIGKTDQEPADPTTAADLDAADRKMPCPPRFESGFLPPGTENRGSEPLRETELGARIADLRAELAHWKRALDEERQGHIEAMTALAQELEALFQQELAAERLRTTIGPRQLDPPGEGETSGHEWAVPRRDFDAELDHESFADHDNHALSESSALSEKHDSVTSPAPAPCARELEHGVARRSLSEESPEARIMSLRKALRLAHDARSKGGLRGPFFFTRLAGIWRKSRRP